MISPVSRWSIPDSAASRLTGAAVIVEKILDSIHRNDSNMSRLRQIVHDQSGDALSKPVEIRIAGSVGEGHDRQRGCFG